MSFRTYLYGILAVAVGTRYAYLYLPGKPAANKQVLHRHRKTRFQAFGPIAIENELSKAKRTIENQAIAFLGAGKYSQLDALAASFRQSQHCFASGSWSLSFFYQALSDLKTEAPEDEWQRRLALLRRWFEEDADCITPRVALARALIGYAWHARGNNWASDVPQNAWPTVYERVTEANRILEAARNLPEKCPCWYSAWMTMGMLAGASHEQYDEVFAEALKNFPSYTPFYFMKTWYLQERWYGKPGEWQTFAKNSADQWAGEKGDVLYAQIVWYIHGLRIYGNPIAESGVEWPRVQRGFEAIRRQNPDSLLALSEYCSISGFAPTGARELMQRLFSELNNRVDLSVWQTLALYQRDYSWTHSIVAH